VASEIHVVSAHRTPAAMIDYGLNARLRGLKVLIAGAGGAAHLPGMLAAVTTLPVIGVRSPSRNSTDWTRCSPSPRCPGRAVATTAINGATNAGLLAARILSLGDNALAIALEEYRQELATQAGQQDRDLPRG